MSDLDFSVLLFSWTSIIPLAGIRTDQKAIEEEPTASLHKQKADNFLFVSLIQPA